MQNTYSFPFAFSGAGYDRAAHLRADSGVLAQQEESRAIVLWRGKVLVAENSLVRLPMNHAALDQSASPVFLGLVEEAPLFACDISRWEPQELDEAALGQFLDPTQQQHPALPKGQVFVELRGIMAGLSELDGELAATAKAVTGWHVSHRFCARCGAESEMVQGGWQRNCAACGGQHFPRTDPVVIMQVIRGDKVLLGRSPAWPEGMYSVLAGFIEPGETFEAAVRREVFEEVGLKVGNVSYVASQPWPFPSSLMIGCEAEAMDGDLVLDEAEIEDALWVTKGDMISIFDGTHPTIKQPRKGAIAGFLMSRWVAQSQQ